MNAPRIIIPSILEKSFEQFANRFKTIATVAPIIQVDIMDGKFVPDISFQEVERINELGASARLEFHLMVNDPLSWTKKLKKVKNIERVIFHIESTDSPDACITTIKKNGWQAGIALKAETDLIAVAPYYNDIEVVLFMLVTPGQQGGQLIVSAGEKIKKFVALKTRPLCATDGGINENNLALVKSWGVEIFGIGSAIVKAKNPAQSYKKFLSLIEK